MNKSNSSNTLQLLVPDPLRRIWLYLSIRDEIQQSFDVQMEITSKGFQFKGNQGNIMQAIEKASSYQKNKIIRPFQTDHEWQKLDKLQNEIQRIDTDKISEICLSAKIQLNADWEYFIIFDKKLQNKIRNVLEDANVKIFDLTIQQAIIVQCTKCIKQIEEKTGCQINLTNNSLGKLFLSIKGGQSSVQEAEKNIRTILKKYKWQLLLSEKQDPSNSLRIPLFGEILKQKDYKTISNQKLKKICKGHPQLQNYFQQYEEKYQKFLAVLIKTQEVGKVKGQLNEFLNQENQKKQQFNQQKWNKSQPRFNSITENTPKTNKNKIKKTKEEEQKQVEFPIDKYVYQGIKKFSNFQTKLTGMQNQYSVEITPEQTQRQDGSVYYSLKFIQPKNQHVIEQGLQFYFNDYKCKEYTALLNGMVNLTKLQRFIQKTVKVSQEFKELIVGDIIIKNGFLKFIAYSGKKDTKSVIEDLQKYISKEINQQIKLIEKK